MKKSVARPRSSRLRAALAAFALAALTLAGCAGDSRPDRRGQSGAEDPPSYGGTLVVASPTDLDYANPLVSGEGFTHELLRYALFMPLVELGPDAELRPWLAEDWELLGDTGVVFRLREDVRWHDGEPTTAYDVAFTYRRARDPETAYPNAQSYFGRWRDVEVVDSFTVRFAFDPHPDPLGGLPYFPILPRHRLEEVPPARLRQAEFNRQPLGNGPFRFVSNRANDRWVFEANDEFPQALGGRPYIDRIVWRVIPESTAQVAELLSGRVDLVLSPPTRSVDELAGRPELQVIERSSRKYHFIAWNGRRAPLNNARVRRALMMAIDRQAIIDGLRGGYGRIAVGPVVPEHWAFAPGIEPLPHDPEAARAILAEAGFQPRGRDGTLHSPDGREFRFALTVPAGNEYGRNVAEMIQDHLARIGVRMTVRTVDAATMFGELTSPDRPFDATFLAWESDLRIDLGDMFHSAGIDGPFQFASYVDPEVDRLLDQLTVVRDREEARPLWHRVQEILRDDQPWGFLFYVPDLYAAGERVRGIEMDARGALVNLREWWLAEP